MAKPLSAEEKRARQEALRSKMIEQHRAIVDPKLEAFRKVRGARKR